MPGMSVCDERTIDHFGEQRLTLVFHGTPLVQAGGFLHSGSAVGAAAQVSPRYSCATQ